MAELRGLLVDYGGVLTNSLSEAMDTWLRADGIDPERFRSLMRRWLFAGPGSNAVHDLETGRMTAEDFERQLAAELAGSPGDLPKAAGLLTRMFSGFRPDAGMAAVVRAVREAGFRTGLLSNSWGLDYPREGWDLLFDVVVISAEVGLRKPDPQIYLLAAERLGLTPAEVVFVDDLAPNVRAAAEIGMVAVQHAGLDATVGELETLLGLSLR
ncbi:MAG TPA: HAD family phosphatase [Mycobacteriales bacterium]|nr:HAD family phosphatase [Mycobacteriales bacterium]